jgi:hypothetical protein
MTVAHICFLNREQVTPCLHEKPEKERERDTSLGKEEEKEEIREEGRRRGVVSLLPSQPVKREKKKRDGLEEKRGRLREGAGFPT